MITGVLQIERFEWGVGETGDTQVLMFQDVDSRLQVRVVASKADFEKICSALRDEKIIQATVIPHEQIKTIEKIKTS